MGSREVAGQRSRGDAQQVNFIDFVSYTSALNWLGLTFAGSSVQVLGERVVRAREQAVPASVARRRRERE